MSSLDSVCEKRPLSLILSSPFRAQLNRPDNSSSVFIFERISGSRFCESSSKLYGKSIIIHLRKKAGVKSAVSGSRLQLKMRVAKGVNSNLSLCFRSALMFLSPPTRALKSHVSLNFFEGRSANLFRRLPKRSCF